MKKINQKSLIASILLERLLVEDICSVSLVGSFCDKNDLSVISDIDTIVVCERLTAEVFEKCVKICRELTGDELGFPDKKVYVNSTFGPLKFDSAENIVIHLMIYDRASHRDHVNKSPFTCFDWERSRIFAGKSLREIYPVMKLQLSDFENARRGIQNYLEDLKRGVITYREYMFSDGTVCEVIKEQALNDRHKAEYAYHIIKNLVCNYCKMMANRNDLSSGPKLESRWKEFLPGTVKFIPLFKKLEAFKHGQLNDIPETAIEYVQDFIFSFESEIKQQWNHSPIIDIIRHQRTSLNDGTFLGQGRDPDIEDLPITTLKQPYDLIFSSPLKRAYHSARLLCPELDIVINEALSEINYGDAEGLTIKQLRQKYPEMLENWAANLDPHFPAGENTGDVLNRAMAFLEDLLEQSCLVVSHNVVLRCVVGSLLGIELEKWHLIDIPHMEPFNLKQMAGRIYLDLLPQQRIRIRDGISMS